MADQGNDATTVPHSGMTSKSYHHVQVSILGKGEKRVVKRILANEDSTFADIKNDLVDADIPEVTVLQSHYGPNPFWTESDLETKIGSSCQTLYAIRGKGVRYILALMRSSEANYPVAIFDFNDQDPLKVALSSPEADSDLEKEKVSITRYSNKNPVYNYGAYESLKSQEAGTFPTCFIITLGEMHNSFQSDMLAQDIPPFLLFPFCSSKELLKRAYGLKWFPRQMIHTTGALLHAIIALARVSNVSESTSETKAELSDEPMLRIDLLLADNLQRIINYLEKILHIIDTGAFDTSHDISKRIDDCFMELCGEFPGAVTIRNSYTILEKLKALDHQVLLLWLCVGAIDALRDISRSIGIVMDPVGQVLEKVTAVLSTLKQMMEKRSAWKTLLITLNAHQQAFHQQLTRLKKETLDADSTSPVLNPIKQYSTVLEEILAAVIKESGLVDKSAPRGEAWETVKNFSSKFINAGSEKHHIQGYDRKVSVSMNHLNAALAPYMSEKLQEIDRMSNVAHNVDESSVRSAQVGSYRIGRMSSVGHNVDENISIFAITIQLAGHARPFKSAGFAINKEEREVQWTRKGDRTLEATFDPPLQVSPSDQLEIRLRRSLSLGGANLFDKDEVTPPIDASEFTNAPSSTEGNTREWRLLFGGNEIMFQVSGPRGLVPTTDEITRICPKFRILLVGKSGVGKSSLINQAFQVKNALVSPSAPGISDIDEGIDHPQFILHDSQGFEPGEVKNLQTVQDFIKRRNNMPELKDKLHAIWICILTPATGSRVLEAGLEEIFRLKRNGDLGKVPIIIVLTKYDALVNREDRLFDDPQYMTEEEIFKQVKKKALATLETVCIAPLKEAVGAEILYAAVSTKDGYQDTLSDLIQLTFDNVKEHIAKEASIVTAMAQNVNSDVKVEALIDVGRFRYWSGLMSNAFFTERRLLDCLEVIHTDILAIWSLKDPDRILQSKTFMVWMSEMVDEISTTELRNPNPGLTAGLPMSVVFVPVVADVVFAKWVHGVYQNRKHMLKRFMAYIIDLTLIVQHIFCLLLVKHYTISRRVVSIVYAAYDISSVKANVHKLITEHVDKVYAAYEISSVKSNVHNLIVEHVDKPITPILGSRDTTFEKIVEIIESNVLRINSAESSQLQSIIETFEGEDGRWYKYQS